MPYIVDTNVVSEIMKPYPNFETICWLQDHEGEYYLTTVTLMELNYGVMRLPDGKRKQNLRRTLDMISREESGRMYSFDGFSAYYCADFRRIAAEIGRTPQLSDCMIAAICKRNDATLVTRNVKDFEYFDIDVVNPFEYESPTLAEPRRREAGSAS